MLDEHILRLLVLSIAKSISFGPSRAFRCSVDAPQSLSRPERGNPRCVGLLAEELMDVEGYDTAFSPRFELQQ